MIGSEETRKEVIGLQSHHISIVKIIGSGVNKTEKVSYVDFIPMQNYVCSSGEKSMLYRFTYQVCSSIFVGSKIYIRVIDPSDITKGGFSRSVRSFHLILLDSDMNVVCFGKDNWLSGHFNENIGFL